MGKKRVRYRVRYHHYVNDDDDNDVDDDDDDDDDVTWRRSFLSFSLADSFKVFTATVLVPCALFHDDT